MPEKLPGWAEEKLRNNKAVYVFNAIQCGKRSFWNAISQHIFMWLNNAVMADANYAELAFESADRIAKKWLELMEAYYPANRVPMQMPDGTLAHAGCPACQHEFDYDYNRYRAAAAVAISCSRCFELIPGNIG
jgi:hypothetical protein